MKKKNIFYLLLILVMFLPTIVFAKEKVNVYLFRKDGCGYCADALTFFNELARDNEYKNYFTLVTKEVSKSKKNSKLMAQVGKYFNDDLKGVPYIVIGEQTIKGYSNDYNDQIKSAIKTAYENESRDIVAEFISQNSDDNAAASTIIILFAIVAGIGFIVYIARNNN